MKKMALALLWCLLLTPLFTLQAQYQFHNECTNSSDFGGILTNDNPDFLNFDGAYLNHTNINMRGCLTPGSADYNDFFYFQVPFGYEITEIRFILNTVSFSAGINVRFWNGADAVPLDSPNHEALDNGEVYVFAGDPPGANLIAGYGPLTPGFYTVRVNFEGWPNTTTYRLQFTFECTDNTAPFFTTLPGILDATLDCDDQDGLDDALDLYPSGTDNSLIVNLNLTGDQTVPDPSCPNSYVRTRTWNLTDDCGNTSANEYIQTITVVDDEAPSFTAPPGLLDVTLDCSDVAAISNATLMVPFGTDGCGSAQVVLISDATTPDAQCAYAYERIRTWIIEDECGNESTEEYTQTIVVEDTSLPQWTTVPGSLDVIGLECSNAVGIAAALAMTPTGTDECGATEAVLLSDQTFEDPTCPNSYERFRTWALSDECGNAGVGVRTQLITVEDNSGPVIEPSNGTVAIYDIAGYELTLEDLIDELLSFDGCGGDLSLVSADPMMVTCADLGQIIPVTFTVSDICGNTTEAVSNIEVTQDLSIKPPWDHEDIGASASGNALHYVCEEEYHVWSDGQAASHLDVAHFTFVEMCGDGELIARVQSVDVAGGFAGVMIREDLSQSSIKMALRKSSTTALRRDIRMTHGAMQNTMNIMVPPMPIWMRITRSGNTVNLYTSMDGANWTFRGTAQPNMSDCVLWGIYTESAMHNHEVTGVFDNVQVTGNIQPPSPMPIFTDYVAIDFDAPRETLSVFPNPSDGLFNLDITDFMGEEIQTEIFSSEGRLIRKEIFKVNTHTQIINIRNHPPGMYLLKVTPHSGIPMISKLVLN